MIVMPADNRTRHVYYWQGKYGGLGWLMNPVTGATCNPWKPMPWAIDNGAFTSYTKKVPWPEEKFYVGVEKLVRKAQDYQHYPLWVVVPDVVADREATLDMWRVHAPRLRKMSLQLAFAAQDGMTPCDVPSDADVVFLGGTDSFKQAAIYPWCQHFDRVHVGRVNTYTMLRKCADAGAESVDGTGFFKGDQNQFRGLERFLREQSGDLIRPPTLFDYETANPVRPI